MVIASRKQEIIGDSLMELFPCEEQMNGGDYHNPVMVAETINNLVVNRDGIYVDCTIGDGGHSLAILQRTTSIGQLVGLDVDLVALERASHRLGQYRCSINLIHDSYTHLADISSSMKIPYFDGVLMDLGLSSFQLDSSGRGFTFQKDEPLDMRFDPQWPVTANIVINRYSVDELTKVISRYGEEPRARAIARAVVARRPIGSSHELATLIASINRQSKKGIHPATRTFQAVRIEVNRELDNVREGLRQAITLLKPGGRLVVISYHSLEDRIAKETFASEAKWCICPPRIPMCVCHHVASVKLISRRVIRPSPQEILSNPRSRSARMRVVEKIP